MKKLRSSLFLSLCFAFSCSIPTTYGASEVQGGTTRKILTLGVMLYGMLTGTKAYNTSFQTYGENHVNGDCAEAVAPQGSGFLVFSEAAGYGPNYDTLLSSFDSDAQWTSSLLLQGAPDDYDEFARVLQNDGNGSYVAGLERDVAPVRRRMLSFGGSDIVVMKGDAMNISDIAWTVQLNGTSDDYISDLTISPNPVYNPTLVATSQSHGAPNQDIQVTQLDAVDGSSVWTSMLDSGGLDFAASIDTRTDAGGGYVVFGTTDGYGFGVGDFVMYFLELNLTGYLDNAYVFGSTADDAAVFLRVNGEGDYVYVGETYGFVVGNATTSDIVLGKMSAGFVPIWTKLVQGIHAEQITSLDLDGNNNIYVGGRVTNITSADRQALLLSFDNNGNFIEASFNGARSGDEEINSIRVVDSNYGVAVGCSDSYTVGGDSDAWVITFGLDDLQGCGTSYSFTVSNVSLLSSSVNPTLTRVDVAAVPVAFNMTYVTPSNYEVQCPAPTVNPTMSPTKMPSAGPTYMPTENPTYMPSESPTESPSKSPTEMPSESPSKSPTEMPSESPSKSPTEMPSESPSKSPTEMPSDSPSKSPTEMPSESPSKSPTEMPSESPSKSPTKMPSDSPTESPSKSPTEMPSDSPTMSPTYMPTESPTDNPTVSPTTEPTVMPTMEPTAEPTMEPSSDPLAVYLIEEIAPTLEVNDKKDPTFLPLGADDKDWNIVILTAIIVGGLGILGTVSYIVVTKVFMSTPKYTPASNTITPNGAIQMEGRNTLFA